MTMEEIAKSLSGRLNEEIADSGTYFTMAQNAMADGCNEAADALFNIAYDEGTHAQYIRDICSMYGMPVNEATEKDFKAMCERLNSLDN